MDLRRSAATVIGRSGFGHAAVCLTAVLDVGHAAAQTQIADSGTPLETVTVKGTQDVPTDASTQATPQAIVNIPQQLMQDQAATRLEDALRNVPGITLNSGEGGAHGDSVNLRGFNIVDSFFFDGMRDPGTYTRDSFDLASVQVLKGPSAFLFGEGSAAGVLNQVSKLPTLAPLRAGTLEFGSNTEFRGTADVNQPISESAAIRLNVMGETSEVTDRDDVKNRRWGFAPSAAFGLGQDTTATISFYHQEENNVPDYGIPFLFGAPAPVPRNLYYGLKNQDVTQTDVNVLTAELRHDFGDGLIVSNTFRYGNYWSNFRVTAPIFGDGNTDGDGEPPGPTPGVPLGQILILRDQPSSEGTQTILDDRTALQAQFTVAGFHNNVDLGVEAGRETNDLVRFFNDADDIAPVPLIAPNPTEATGGSPQEIDARPSTSADMLGIFAADTVALGDAWSVTGGLRFDRVSESFDDPLSVAHFDRTDTAVSPRGAVLFAPTDSQSYYFSYATSFDPSIAYLTLAPSNAAPAPERARTFELGVKTLWLDNLLSINAALFDTRQTNVRIADPDDPTLQLGGAEDQVVKGGELAISGYITPQWEVTAGFSLQDPKIDRSSTVGEAGHTVADAARFTANSWVTYKPTDDLRIGTGVDFVGRRYADALNTASVPSYARWDGMVGYRLTDNVDLQMTIKNITDETYYGALYYSDATENHVIPGPGRTFTLTTSFRF